MRVEYHPAVEHDVAEALRRYDAVSERLGDEFKAELRRVVQMAAENPNRFHSIKPGFHRANLKRFPYHFIYREQRLVKGRSPAVSGLTVTHRAADEEKFPALCRAAPLGRHLCRTNAKEFPSSARSAIVRQRQRRCILQPKVARHELPWGKRFRD